MPEVAWNNHVYVAHHRNYFRRQGKIPLICLEMMILKFKARQVCLEGYFVSFQKISEFVSTIYLHVILHGGNMNTQHTSLNPKRSLRSRDKVIRLIWPVLKEQAQLFVNDNNQQSEDTLSNNSCQALSERANTIRRGRRTNSFT